MGSAPDIVTVTLNPSIDQTVCIPEFSPGAVNRVAWEQSDAGGKGVNVACCLAAFGHTVAVTGLLGSANQALFLRVFAERRLIDRFVRVPGQTRVNVKVVDDIRQQVTDINFAGITTNAKDFSRLSAAIETLIGEGAQIFVLSGSVPAGARPTIYRELVAQLKACGRRVVVDTSGEALAQAIEAGPNVIKPNIEELATLVGCPLADTPAIVGAARHLHAQGMDLVAVSMGDRGALFVSADAVIHAIPPAVAIRSTVGAGDAMVAGIVHSLVRNLGVEDRARLATAFSLGSLGEIGPRLPPGDVIEAFARQVKIRHVAT